MKGKRQTTATKSVNTPIHFSCLLEAQLVSAPCTGHLPNSLGPCSHGAVTVIYYNLFARAYSHAAVGLGVVS